MTADRTFFLSSGFPLLTDARNSSPTDPDGNLESLAPIAQTAIIYKFLAPVLSPQFITQSVGKHVEIFNFVPLLPPLALLLIVNKDLMIDS